jgi:hypothetical protein
VRETARSSAQATRRRGDRLASICPAARRYNTGYGSRARDLVERGRLAGVGGGRERPQRPRRGRALPILGGGADMLDRRPEGRRAAARCGGRASADPPLLLPMGSEEAEIARTSGGEGRRRGGLRRRGREVGLPAAWGAGRSARLPLYCSGRKGGRTCGGDRSGEG